MCCSNTIIILLHGEWVHILSNAILHARYQFSLVPSLSQLIYCMKKVGEAWYKVSVS